MMGNFNAKLRNVVPCFHEILAVLPEGFCQKSPVHSWKSPVWRFLQFELKIAEKSPLFRCKICSKKIWNYFPKSKIASWSQFLSKNRRKIAKIDQFLKSPHFKKKSPAIFSKILSPAHSWKSPVWRQIATFGSTVATGQKRRWPASTRARSSNNNSFCNNKFGRLHKVNTKRIAPSFLTKNQEILSFCFRACLC